MTTKSYLLEATETVMNVIDYIERHIMGFTSFEYHADDDEFIEYTVQLRTEDVPWLEETLAPIVQVGAIFLSSYARMRSLRALFYYNTEPHILSSKKLKKFAQKIFPKIVQFYC